MGAPGAEAQPTEPTLNQRATLMCYDGFCSFSFSIASFFSFLLTVAVLIGVLLLARKTTGQAAPHELPVPTTTVSVTVQSRREVPEHGHIRKKVE